MESEFLSELLYKRLKKMEEHTNILIRYKHISLLLMTGWICCGFKCNYCRIKEPILVHWPLCWIFSLHYTTCRYFSLPLPPPACCGRIGLFTRRTNFWRSWCSFWWRCWFQASAARTWSFRKFPFQRARRCLIDSQLVILSRCRLGR